MGHLALLALMFYFAIVAVPCAMYSRPLDDFSKKRCTAPIKGDSKVYGDSSSKEVLVEEGLAAKNEQATPSRARINVLTSEDQKPSYKPSDKPFVERRFLFEKDDSGGHIPSSMKVADDGRNQSASKANVGTATQMTEKHPKAATVGTALGDGKPPIP